MKTLAVRQRTNRRNKKSARRNRLSRLERLEARQLLAGDISGTVYNDVDANGIRNQDDFALTNWTVYLDLNQNGNLDAGEPSELTDADGKYRFRGIDAGDYRVTEVLRSDWTAINPASGFIDVTVVDGENARVDFFNNGGGGTATITGNVWRDLNNDGIQDPGDTGVAGWTLYLDLNGDRILDPDEPVEFTDGDGNYTFSNILGGGVGDAIDYEVVEILTPGWEATANHSEDYTVSVIEGEITTVPDFANTPIDASRVEGTIYNDANGNGLRDAGEPGLSSWTVYADLNTNNVLDAGEPSDITDTQGRYSLIALEPGTHRISVIQPINFQPISPAAGYQSAVAPSQDTVSNINFGFQERTDAAIGGVVYVDRNHDGVRDPGEEGLAGITVYIDDNNNGVLDPGEPSVQTSDDRFYTPDVDEAGTYRFESLAAGTYHIRQIIPETLSSTPELEREHSVTVGPTDDRSDVDCGDRYRPSEIHGFKFEDVNGNALRDAGEPGIAGVTIYIDLNRNNLLDPGEPTTLTAVDGSYSFDGLETDSYVIRELVPAGFVQTFPTTKDGILWPEGTSNAPIGNVTPSLIEASLSDGETLTETVSLTLPTTGALTNMVDVFLLFDDTGSFTSNSPIVRAAFPNIISQLQTRLTGIDLGFGVGRLEEYGNFASEYAQGRPFTLNQPIVAADVPGFEASIQAALDHVAPGYGGDRPETVIEALYQMVTGAGFDGNDNGSVLDSGAAGALSTQTSPGSSGDVPSFDSFTADPANGILPASGTIGGAGFRSGALPIIITATDTGFAYQPKGDDTIVGIDGLTIPRSQVVSTGRATTPFSSGAGVQETVTGLNALGALVIGLGTNDAASADPRQGLESLASLTGAVNRTANPIDNGTPDTIAPGDPLYFKIGSGGDPLVGNIADGIVAAIEGAVTSVNVNVTLRASDPRVHIDFAPGVLNGLGAGDTATFDVTFTGDGRPHRFDLQFVREGTDVVLGSIPIVLGTPISGDGYEFEDCDDGEITSGTDFGNQRIDGFIPNVAPSFTAGANQALFEDAGTQSISAWATNIVSGPAGEPAQNVDFIVSNDNNALFAVQPTLAADGTLSFTPADDAFGTANVTVQLHDDGGTAGGGSDTSAPQVFVIDVAPVNDAPGFTAGADVTVDQDAPTQTIANWATALSSGPANESTQTLGFIVTNNNNALFSSQPAISSDGTLTFTPAAGMNGSATITVQIFDDGGTTDGGVDTSVAQTFAITVNAPPANVAPSFTGGANQVVLEDAGTQSISAWATNIVSGPAGEPAQNVDFIVSNDNNALFAVQPTLAADGTLSFTPADDAFGTANVTVQLHDDGGTAGGGSDTSAPQVFVIDVAPVNDAPGFTAGADVTVDQDAPIQTIANWATALSSGPANESTQTLGFIVTNNNNALFSSQPAISSDGTLTFTPAAGMMGYATVSVTVVDDGGTANGGFNFGITQTFQIHVVSPPKPEDSAFFVVDYTRNRVFQYETNGDLFDSVGLDKEDKKPRGIATSPDGSTSWVINKDGEIFIYDDHQRTLGFWKAAGIDKPQGITVHGDNLWIVDAEANRVLLYVGGASTRKGEWTPTSRFDLSSENQHPTDLVTNGDSIWVLDDARRIEKVYRYTIDGTPTGSWSLDPQQRNPTGITLDHSDPNDFWIVDANTDAVYHYDQATKREAGQQSADFSFPLTRRNGNPQGISSRGLASTAATAPAGSGTASLPAPPPSSYDVNADGTVSLLDALFLINRLEEQAEGELQDFVADFRLDVNGDEHVSAADALAIVNQLASRSSDSTSLDLAFADDTEDYLSDLHLSSKDLLK